jgi:NTE family protein
MREKQRLQKENLNRLREESTKSIERVVCSGGGAKGVVYPGSYKAMVDTGVFMGVKKVSGASAGAITATLMAVGIPPLTLRTLLLETNFEDLLGERIGNVFTKNRPGLAFLTKDGKPLLEYIRKNINETVKNKLDELDYPDELKRIYKKLETKQAITFGDLKILNQIYPEHFKELVIPAVKFPNGEIQIFNGDLTPDVEIALACRASSSIPVILEPVNIKINGEIHTFVDGGVFDNLPTDFFDGVDENGNFIKNTKPTQTLVFAFGEGLDHESNQVFQALYGQQWDETVTDQALETILKAAIHFSKKIMESQDEIDTPENEAKLLSYALKLVLEKQVQTQEITREEAKVILGAMQKSIKDLLLNPQDYQEFWKAHKDHKTTEKPFAILAAFVKKQMKVILYKADVFEKLKRDVLIEVLGDFSAPYKNTAQKEIGFQKLRSEYALRTVELRVGDITTTDFKEANKVARVMDALGYLDTINHITNHELHDEEFDDKKYFDELVDNFEKIYKAVLLGAGENPAKDELTQDIAALKTKLLGIAAQQARLSGKDAKPINNRQLYQLIKDRVESELDSTEAFALSRAVEFGNKMLSADDLFKETYEEGFKRSGVFAVSNITGEQVLTAKTLHKQLKDQSMFDLYENQKAHQEPTRTDIVYNALNELKNFKRDQEMPSDSKLYSPESKSIISI